MNVAYKVIVSFKVILMYVLICIFYNVSCMMYIVYYVCIYTICSQLHFCEHCIAYDYNNTLLLILLPCQKYKISLLIC